MHHQATGAYTFQYGRSAGHANDSRGRALDHARIYHRLRREAAGGPLAPWLPDAHTEAPTAGSVILAGLLLKTGAYGLLRFVVPLFPDAAHEFTPVALVLAVIGILYGAVMAFAQTDLKRLVAYTSVSHLGFVLLGIFSWNSLGLQGAVMTMICSRSEHRSAVHPGRRAARTHPYSRHGPDGRAVDDCADASAGRRSSLPWHRWACRDWGISSASSWFCWARIKSASGSPSWLPSGFWPRRSMPFAWCSGCSMGKHVQRWQLPDLSPREALIVAPMIIALLWLGLYPQPVLNTFAPAMHNLQREANLPAVVRQER